MPAAAVAAGLAGLHPQAMMAIVAPTIRRAENAARRVRVGVLCAVKVACLSSRLAIFSQLYLSGIMHKV
jgi:hypothetical protein